jgi:hypothetical protein
LRRGAAERDHGCRRLKNLQNRATLDGLTGEDSNKGDDEPGLLLGPRGHLRTPVNCPFCNRLLFVEIITVSSTIIFSPVVSDNTA